MARAYAEADGPLDPLERGYDGPIKILVGFVPGGTSDTVARMLAEELRPSLGRNVIVENKPGAGGRLARSHRARGRTRART